MLQRLNRKLTILYFLIVLDCLHAFIPHPSIRIGGQAGNSVTHSEITQLGFIRSLARFLFETNALNNNDYSKEYTIDELYQLVNPTWTKETTLMETYPLKNILDIILAENALVDVDSWTKKLSAAHFDSEAFRNASRRIIKLRQTVIQAVLNKTEDLKPARRLLGQLLHTLQDFYSHSNWVELGKKNINERIGIYEDIGPVAGKNQPTCTNDGCVKMKVKCTFYQKLTLKKCPLEYYECKNNVRMDIVEQGLLTSGYSVNQHNEENDPIVKPTNVEKCSHGSVMDTSSHVPAIGGINKDTITPIYSPHFDLHYQAATLAILATERFFNDLRTDLGDLNFDRLFAIHPTAQDYDGVSKATVIFRQFKFFTPSISSGFSMGSALIDRLRQTAKDRWDKIKAIFFHSSTENEYIDEETFEP